MKSRTRQSIILAQQSSDALIVPYKHNDPVCSSPDNQVDLESSAQIQWWLRTRFVTTILVNLGNIMERADEQILPALYGFVAASFHIGPTQLGYLTLSRALVQAVASPLGGILGELTVL